MACLHVNSTTSTKNIQEHDIHFASAKAQLLNHCRRSTWFRHVAKLQWSFGVSLPPKVVLIGQVGNDQNLNIIERKMEDRLVLDLEDSENSIFNMCVCYQCLYLQTTGRLKRMFFCTQCKTSSVSSTARNEEHIKLRINRFLWSYEARNHSKSSEIVLFSPGIDTRRTRSTGTRQAESQTDVQSQMPLVSPKWAHGTDRTCWDPWVPWFSAVAAIPRVPSKSAVFHHATLSVDTNTDTYIRIRIYVYIHIL
jgi:hypothetical protein